MLLLAALLAASSQLTLSSRRTTADQTASLRAQYVAESGVAVAQSRLRDVQTLLSAASLRVPYGTTASTIKSYAEKYCGNAAWAASTVTAVAAGGSTPVQTCTVGTTTAPDQFEVFARFVKPGAYSEVLPGTERPAATDVAALQAWWRGQLRDNQTLTLNDATINYRLRPDRVEYYPALGKYRFYIQFGGLNAGSEQNNAARVLKASRAAQSGWWLEISLPGYLDNVLFTNHHTSDPGTASTWKPQINFNDQVFDGPIHTNERFLFTPGSTASFQGRVTSAGCTNLLKTGLNADGGCTKTAGYYVGGGDPGNLRTAASSAITTDQKNSDLAQKLRNDTNVQLARQLNPDGSPSDRDDLNFLAEYRPMPTNANSQRDAAQGRVPADKAADPYEVDRYTAGRGLYFTDNVAGIVLAAGDANGNSPGAYNDRTKKWTPEPTYQYIKVAKKSTPVKTGTERRCIKSSNGSCTEYAYYDVYRYDLSDFDEYRVNADGRMEKKGLTGWTSYLSKFNGVIFSEGSIQVLKGPDRKDGLAPPALAPFSKITAAAQQDINIAGDLTLSDQPCHPNDAPCKADKPQAPDNVLGIYTQKGDVAITKEAPDNLNLHAMLMSSEGEVRVDGYSFGAPRGNVNLIGGLVENWYGAFGTFNPATRQPSTGFGRNFSHDRRFEDPGFTPPFFPQSPTWVPTDAGTALQLSSFVLNQGSKSDLGALP